MEFMKPLAEVALPAVNAQIYYNYYNVRPTSNAIRIVVDTLKPVHIWYTTKTKTVGAGNCPRAFLALGVLKRCSRLGAFRSL
jgi:hypothetical protein